MILACAAPGLASAYASGVTPARYDVATRGDIAACQTVAAIVDREVGRCRTLSAIIIELVGSPAPILDANLDAPLPKAPSEYSHVPMLPLLSVMLPQAVDGW